MASSICGELCSKQEPSVVCQYVAVPEVVCYGVRNVMIGCLRGFELRIVPFEEKSHRWNFAGLLTAAKLKLRQALLEAGAVAVAARAMPEPVVRAVVRLPFDDRRGAGDTTTMKNATSISRIVRGKIIRGKTTERRPWYWRQWYGRKTVEAFGRKPMRRFLDGLIERLVGPAASHGWKLMMSESGVLLRIGGIG